MTLEAVVGNKVERVIDGRNLLNNLRLIDAETWETSQKVFKAWQNGVPVVPKQQKTRLQGIKTTNKVLQFKY